MTRSHFVTSKAASTGSYSWKQDSKDIEQKKKKSAHKTHKVVPCIYYPSEMNNRRGKMLCSQSPAHSNKHVRHSRLDALFIVKD